MQVYGSGTTNPFLVSSSSGTSLMVINNQGNVGIGTTTMSGSGLTVSQSANTPSGIYVKNGAGIINASITLDSAGVTADNGVRFAQNGTRVWEIGQLGSSVNGTGDLYFQETGIGTSLTLKKEATSVSGRRILGQI